jgi:hypothetical protein
MPRPKLSRANVEEILTLHSQRPRPSTSGLAVKFAVTVPTIHAVLHGTYVPLDDYLEKQHVMCTRCGSKMHPTQMTYADHAHLFSAKAYHCPDCIRYCNTHPATKATRRKSMQKTYLRQTVAALLKTAVIEQMNAGNFEIVITDRKAQRWVAHRNDALLSLTDGQGDWVYLTTTGRSRARLFELEEQIQIRQSESNKAVQA